MQNINNYIRVCLLSGEQKVLYPNISKRHMWDLRKQIIIRFSIKNKIVEKK